MSPHWSNLRASSASTQRRPTNAVLGLAPSTGVVPPPEERGGKAPQAPQGGVLIAEGQPSWWVGRASNPVGGAMRRRVGSTPMPFRPSSLPDTAAATAIFWGPCHASAEAPTPAWIRSALSMVRVQTESREFGRSTSAAPHRRASATSTQRNAISTQIS